MQIGIVGLPFCGKSTLFQTITKTYLDPAALAKAETHRAIVEVPDARLDRLSGIFSPKSTVHATIEFVDVVGLKKGESGTTQFSTNFLADVKTNDALVQVVRMFANSAVPHPDGAIDPARDISTFETEFILSDLGIIELRIDRINKQLSKSGNDTLKKELPVLEKCRQVLEAGTSLRAIDITKEEERILRTYQLLSIKPMLIALNLDEDPGNAADELISHFGGSKGSRNSKVISFHGKIELEMSELAEEEAKTFMKEYGIGESALSALLRGSYELLGLQSFFTVGEDECRAWTIRRGMTAQEAAGAIHSDFVGKFIRAEVVSYDDFIAQGGSFARAKEAGQWRLEGKEYVVNDGDIMSIRHS